MPFASLPARIRSLIGLASLAFLVAQALPWPAFGPGRAPGAAKAAAIEMPQALETCPHHPQGCPPDCRCAKIHQDPGGEETGAISGPALVRCTALGDSITPAPPGPFLPAGPIAIRFPERLHALPAFFSQATAPGFRPAPAKIPIA
jgi:hypothetical protein